MTVKIIYSVQDFTYPLALFPQPYVSVSYPVSMRLDGWCEKVSVPEE
jgi:hypothetical protein